MTCSREREREAHARDENERSWGLGRGEEAVEVEWQAVELLVPGVALERPEPLPPRHPPVLARVLHLQRVVQEHGHHQPHRRRRREDGVDVVVELHAFTPAG